MCIENVANKQSAPSFSEPDPTIKASHPKSVKFPFYNILILNLFACQDPDGSLPPGHMPCDRQHNFIRDVKTKVIITKGQVEPIERVPKVAGLNARFEFAF